MKNMRYFFTLVCVLFALSFGQDYGLEERIPNKSLLIKNSTPSTEVELVRVFENLNFFLPLFFTHAGDGSNRVFIVQKYGVILVFDNNNEANEYKTFLKLTRENFEDGTSETGLLGLAFHPDFKNNRKFYISYTAPGLKSIISEVLVSDDPDSADLSTQRILIEEPQPYANHNGGMIAFGPDGYLYIALGDGGSGGDPLNNGQNRRTALGSILRINVDSKDAELEYNIPADNPFFNATDSSRKEIWAYGLRNPWRFSFDRELGTLWAGDVGQNKWEEVDIIKKGGNYGWKIMEGFNCFPGGNSCDTSGLVLPIVEYSHDIGFSITGGYVYRGTEIEGFQGTYVYGDYSTRLIWGMHYDNGQLLENKLISESPSRISSFGEDEAGELYVVGYDGIIYKFVAKIDSSTGINVPPTISESGLYSDVNSFALSPGLIEYDLNAPFWSDGAYKQRVIALPDTTRIEFNKDSTWNFPNEAVIVKNFFLEIEKNDPQNRKIIETRFMVKRSDSELWDGFSYWWNDEQTDAFLLDSSATRFFTITDPDAPGGQYTQEYYYPSRRECLSCHGPESGYVLGLRTTQINKDFTYENGVTDNQLRSYNNIELFTWDIGEDYSDFPKWPNPFDQSADLELRARAYLATNCAQCHRPGSSGRTNIDLRFDTPLIATHLVNVNPDLGDLGVIGAKRVLPGYPDSSLLYLRMLDLAENRMPPVGSKVIDQQGVNLIGEWITSLKTTSLTVNQTHIPTSFNIKAYPNPFNPQTQIVFDLPQQAFVELNIFDIRGGQVVTLVNEFREAGTHIIKWDARNKYDRKLPSGIYFYRINAISQTQQFKQVNKLILLK